MTGTKLISTLTVHLYFPADCDLQEIKREMTFFYFRRILKTVFKLPDEMKYFKKSTFAIGGADKVECNSPTLYGEHLVKYIGEIGGMGKFVEPAVLTFSVPFDASTCTSWLLIKTTFDLSVELNSKRLFTMLVPLVLIFSFYLTSV